MLGRARLVHAEGAAPAAWDRPAGHRGARHSARARPSALPPPTTQPPQLLTHPAETLKARKAPPGRPPWPWGVWAPTQTLRLPFSWGRKERAFGGHGTALSFPVCSSCHSPQTVFILLPAGPSTLPVTHIPRAAAGRRDPNRQECKQGANEFGFPVQCSRGKTR